MRRRRGGGGGREQGRRIQTRNDLGDPDAAAVVIGRDLAVSIVELKRGFALQVPRVELVDLARRCGDVEMWV